VIWNRRLPEKYDVPLGVALHGRLPPNLKPNPASESRLMKDPRVPLKSRGLAALLAFLVPGAGHFYQGRRLKGSIFTACILTMFLGGLILGEGQPVYSQVVHASEGSLQPAQLQTGPPRTEKSLGYFAQVFVGLPSMPALLQTWRHHSRQNLPETPSKPISEPFRGDIKMMSDDGEQSLTRVNGQLSLTPGSSTTVNGNFKGTTAAGDAIEFNIEGRATLGKPVFGAPGREVVCSVSGEDSPYGGQLSGTIPRPFHNWFQAPRDYEELDRLHGTLSDKFDIACVFTWIAGLLNVMAIWDAFDGPAYGYGDEEDGEDE